MYSRISVKTTTSKLAFSFGRKSPTSTFSNLWLSIACRAALCRINSWSANAPTSSPTTAHQAQRRRDVQVMASNIEHPGTEGREFADPLHSSSETNPMFDQIADILCISIASDRSLDLPHRPFRRPLARFELAKTVRTHPARSRRFDFRRGPQSGIEEALDPPPQD